MTLAEIKTAVRVTAADYDLELTAIAMAAMADLRSAGITVEASLDALTDPLQVQAVKTYVRTHFGSPPDRDRLEASYSIQKQQLMHLTGHTTWAGDGA